MLLLSVARNQIILAEAVELAWITILILMLHFAGLTAVIGTSATIATHNVIGPTSTSSAGVTVILIYLGVCCAFAISHVLCLVHTHVVIVDHVERQRFEHILHVFEFLSL